MVATWCMLEQRGRALAEEAGASVAAGRCLDPGWLAEAARWLADGTPPWADVVGGAPSERDYRLIVSSLHLEAWFICWPSGGRLALHDHGGASGALQVVDGTLTEEHVIRGRPPVRRRLPTGSLVSFDGRYVHDVANTGGGLATSVHVYSAAERPMAHYRFTDDGHLVPLVPPAGPDLHPAGSGR